MKPSGIGGQAVIEGVMMRNREAYAVAVRTQDKKIEIDKGNFHTLGSENKFLKIPVIRGVLAFVDSLRLGMKTLTFSASFFEEEEEKNPRNEKKESILMGITMVLAVVIAVGIFILLPFFISNLLSRVISSAALCGLIEGVIRVALFVGYVKIISRMEDIRRVFMYHGAEHKTINCVENGLNLTVENIRRQSRVHKRCGTSFLLFVMLISILFFMFIVVDSLWIRMVLRIVLIPVIAGVAYEFIKLAGRSESKVIGVLSKPGLWLQGLTTKEPDDDMIEVAIASVEAVFDWRAFLAEDNSSIEAATEVETEEPSVSYKSDITKADDGIEIISVEESEEDDAILKALDRYFEDPVKKGTKE